MQIMMLETSDGQLERTLTFDGHHVASLVGRGRVNVSVFSTRDEALKRQAELRFRGTNATVYRVVSGKMRPVKPRGKGVGRRFIKREPLVTVSLAAFVPCALVVALRQWIVVYIKFSSSSDEDAHASLSTFLQVGQSHRRLKLRVEPFWRARDGIRPGLQPEGWSALDFSQGRTKGVDGKGKSGEGSHQGD